MLISHKHKFIYLKTQKTAGTAVEAVFEKYCTDKEDHLFLHYRPGEESEAGVIGFRGLTYKDTSKWQPSLSAEKVKELVGDDVWGSYFKFCTIRNPYEKAISRFYWQQGIERMQEYYDSIGESDNENRWVDLDRFKLPADFVFNQEDEVSKFNEWLFTNNYFRTDCFAYNIKFKWIEEKHRGTFIPEVDAFIRYENLEEDIQKVRDSLNLPREDIIIPKFKSGYRPKEATCKVMFNEERKAKIVEHFSVELDYFNYTFPED